MEKDSIIKSVKDILFALGFKMKLVGSKYLYMVVAECFDDEHAYKNLSACAYPSVAKKCSTSAMNVEHAIRNAIRDCYEHGNLYYLNKLIGSEVISKQYQPTNSEIIATLFFYLNDSENLSKLNQDCSGDN